jgi:hypothetical protein
LPDILIEIKRAISDDLDAADGGDDCCGYG